MGDAKCSAKNRQFPSLGGLLGSVAGKDNPFLFRDAWNPLLISHALGLKIKDVGYFRFL